MPLISTDQGFIQKYKSLPHKQQKNLEEIAGSYISALDRAIMQVLSPSVGKSDNQFLVTDEFIPLYGIGATPEEAMEDYRSVVIEYYENLESDSEDLTTSLQGQLEILRRIFVMIEGR
jgi:hypothetical protein